VPATTWYRNRSYSLLITVVACLFALASIVGTLRGGGSWAPVVVVVTLSAFCLWRLARAGVYADADGIRVLNPTRTTRIAWEDVLRFRMRSHKGFAAVGFAELVDGTQVLCWGLQARSRNAAAMRIPEAVVEELNERLAAERAARTPSP